MRFEKVVNECLKCLKVSVRSCAEVGYSKEEALKVVSERAHAYTMLLTGITLDNNVFYTLSADLDGVTIYKTDMFMKEETKEVIKYEDIH